MVEVIKENLVKKELEINYDFGDFDIKLRLSKQLKEIHSKEAANLFQILCRSIAIEDFWTCFHATSQLYIFDREFGISFDNRIAINFISVNSEKIIHPKFEVERVEMFLTIALIMERARINLKHGNPRKCLEILKNLKSNITTKISDKYSYMIHVEDFIKAVPFYNELINNKSTSKNKVLLDTILNASGKHVHLFKDKFCKYASSHLEIDPGGAIYYCCPSYAPIPQGNIFNENESAIYNLEGKNRKDFVDSINNGTYRMCSLMNCARLNNISEDSEKNIFQDQPIEMSTSLKTFLSYDRTCNLWCPSCRPSKETVIGNELDQLMDVTNKKVLEILKYAHSAMLNGYGDLFASKVCRHIMRSCDDENFPNLKYDIITNAVLFTEDITNRFPSFMNKLRSVRVSMDASTEDTYSKVRLGGDWGKLNENMKFISKLKKTKKIEKLSISMVVQYANYKEIVEFFKLARSLKCDTVVFEFIMNWNLEPEQYRKMAVHEPIHPNYPEFKRIVKELYLTGQEESSQKTEISFPGVFEFAST